MIKEISKVVVMGEFLGGIGLWVGETSWGKRYIGGEEMSCTLWRGGWRGREI